MQESSLNTSLKNVEKLAQFCSCVKSFLVLWENPQWTAAELHPCLTLPLPSGVESSHSNQNKYSIFSVAIILFVFSLETAPVKYILAPILLVSK